MKYILKKDLPLVKAGSIVELYSDDSGRYTKIWLPQDEKYDKHIATLPQWDYSEWLEEKEPKTIYDLKEGDGYWYLYLWHTLQKIRNSWEWKFVKSSEINCFLTEREAKRNKLLRELATRTDKYMPRRWTTYINYDWEFLEFEWNRYHFMMYNMWLVFRDKEEYNKWITDENRDLLFNL